MRACIGPLLASQVLNNAHSKNLERSPLRFMQTGKALNAFRATAVSELIVEKCKLYDPLIGVLEDAVVICSGIQLVRKALEIKPRGAIN